MLSTAAKNFVASPIATVTTEDPYAIAIYDADGRMIGYCHRWRDANLFFEALAAQVPTDDPVSYRIEAFYGSGAIVFQWDLSRAHQLGAEVAGAAWNQGMLSGGIIYV